MWVLDKQWEPGYCDYFRHEKQVRISVTLWLRLSRIDDTFISQRRGLHNVFDYVREYGLRQTIRKVNSRVSERSRNRKFVVFGIGEIGDADAGSEFSKGDRVAFVAPIHPTCVDNVCVDEELVRAIEPDQAEELFPGTVLEGVLDDLPAPIEAVAGWSRYSGCTLDESAVETIITKAMKVIEAKPFLTSLNRLKYTPNVIQKRPPRPENKRPSAVVFGLGHYCKNIVLPRFAPYLSIDCIHEIDPTQIGKISGHSAEIRTSAIAEDDEEFDVYIISGYHHTHAAIAAHAIRKGAVAVVEKPLVTNECDLEDLLEAVRTGPGRIFSAFQRRYNKFNDFMKIDLDISVGSVVHCQCIVYETPLPANHWYRWPASGTRITSNGCHWIDHFLMLNGFSDAVSINVDIRANGDVNTMIDLENGASFSMVITDHGSRRLGVRDTTEFRVKSRTATIIDQSRYRAESTAAIIRKASILRSSSYDRMYDEIAKKIVAGDPGDSILSIEVSARIMLEADRWLRKKIEKTGPYIE